MSQVRAMVSSTCFDLAPVRESICKCLESLGFAPLMSERSTFPALPHLSTFDNCRRAARQETDLLVLIVGGRRGTVVPGTDSTITNLEYREARAANVPILIFIQSRVLDLVSVWRKNPEGDYGSHVDSTGVFEFVEELQQDNRWIVPFSSTADIEDGIRNRSSQLFRYLLDLRRGLEEGSNAAFANESAKVRDMLISKPENWEHKLFAELLIDRLRPMNAHLMAIRAGSVFLPGSEIVSVRLLSDWVHRQTGDLLRLVEVLKQVMQVDVSKALGPLGVPADLPAVLDCANRIADCCQAALRIEERSRSVLVHKKMRKVVQLTNVWGGDVLLDVFKFAEMQHSFLNTPGLTGHHSLEVKFNEPKGCDQLSGLLAELEEAVRASNGELLDADWYEGSSEAEE